MQAGMPPRAQWVEHPIDQFRGSWMQRHNARSVPAILPCPCRIDEPHEHCSHCGRLVSKGSGETIATYRINL